MQNDRILIRNTDDTGSTSTAKPDSSVVNLDTLKPQEPIGDYVFTPELPNNTR